MIVDRLWYEAYPGKTISAPMKKSTQLVLIPDTLLTSQFLMNDVAFC